jgi:Tol biopolymer transport system component
LTLLPTGAGEPRSVLADGTHVERVEWFPDGQRILFNGNEPGKPARTFAIDANGGKPVAITPEGMIAARISPDQKYVTVAAQGKLNLFPIAGGDLKPIADLEKGETILGWSGDGKFIFSQQATDRASLTIRRVDVATGRKEVWREISPPDRVGVTIREAVITPDGKSYAYSYQRDISTLYLAEGLK